MEDSMANPAADDDKNTTDKARKDKELDRELDQALQDSFPGSDPASVTQPAPSKEDASSSS